MSRLLPALGALLVLPWLTGLTPPLYTPSRVEAVDLGPAFRGAHPSVLGLDGAYSLPLGDRKSLWIFGDTLIGSWQPGGRRLFVDMPPNTGAIASDDGWLKGFGKAAFLGGAKPSVLVPSKETKRRLWPLDAVTIANKHWLFWVQIEPFGKGPLDFKVTGTGVSEGQGSRPSHFAIKPALWPGEAPTFGTSALVRDKMLYLFAGGAQTHLARMPLGDPTKSRYSYWAGDGRWVDDWREAAALPESGPEMSVRYNPYLQHYVMIYVPPFGQTIESRYAPQPWGPWSEPVRVATCQPAQSGAMFYGAKQHVQFDVEYGKRIVLTYNTNAPEEQLMDRPDLYWPRVVRVTFER